MEVFEVDLAMSTEL